MKILLVEDEQELGQSIKSFLNGESIPCEVARNLWEAEDKVLSSSFDIVLLDIMLPDGNGLDFLKELKRRNSELGVLILSAKNALDDKLMGFELGADDYITKPFHFSELNARLKALYRRKNFQGSKLIQFKELSIDPEKCELKINKEQVELTQKEYELLMYFLANKNRIVTKQSIAEHLWGEQMDWNDSFDFVYQHIKNLRKKLQKHEVGHYIKTAYGMGYKFQE